jgi:hypothetical protein
MSSKPKWWQLYLLLPLAVLLFVLERRLPFSTSGHRAAQIGIILVTYGLAHLWLRANRAALTETEQERHQWEATLIVSVIPNPLDGETRSGDGRQPALLLPEPESKSKNTLGDTSKLDPVEHFPAVLSTHEI